ncbi:fibronectin type III domain-containing protein [Pontibacter sp. SGAir0037]|uniref:fibronectin type III domain-containing protein n=1 Tax=Pontibacter sp. SGAir0037 TaxID=2571030 RepID=UPI0010CCDC4A|nr:fibronectin type III domain-containing protein [Pontibacter sp. SGAir0037]QCR21163.1 hypothetical protein C1N53_01545 [Pontibacter sp. SGAir0037]
MNTLLKYAIALALFLCCYQKSAAQITDITNDGGKLSVQHELNNSSENFQKLIDNNIHTKYYIKKQQKAWIIYQPVTPTLLSSYTLTSATDNAGRDPKNWLLEGSLNGTDWTMLDTQQNQTFAKRTQTRTFSLGTTIAYKYYRLNITANNGDNSIQLAEWELWGVAVPEAPANLTAEAQSTEAISLAWGDASADEAGFEINLSADGISYSPVATVGAGVTTYLQEKLSPGTTYYFKVRAIGATGNSNFSNVAKAATEAIPEDITNNGGVISSQYSSRVASENYDKLIDDNVNTKYFQNGQKALWVQYQSAYAAVLEYYAITSANDSPDRDPRSWNLQGSIDGENWITLDTQSNQSFASRFETKTYPLSTTAAYMYYRLNITANNGSVDSQFAEWVLWGKKSSQQPPAAPGNVTATALSDRQVKLTWADNSDDEESFRISRSADGATFFTVATGGANQTSFTDQNLSAGTTYSYRIYAINAGGLNYASSPVVTTQPLQTLADITDFEGGVISDQYNTAGAEGIAKLTDNNLYTKYLTFNRTTWMQFYVPEGAVVSQYALTSANDAPERDPTAWRLEGSNDGANWTTLHELRNQLFPSRHRTLTYGFENSTAYTYYRLHVTANRGASIVQVAELQLFGTGAGSPSTEAPGVPANFTATAVTDNQIIITWNDNSLNETGYRLERSADGSNWDWHTAIDANNTRYHSFSLAGNTTYYYRLRAEGVQGNSDFTAVVSATTPSATAPATWQEHWFDHNKVVSLVYENPDLNLYFDENMDNSAEWMKTTFTDVWKYTRETYGGYSDPKLYAVMHLNSYSGGHPATVFDPSHDYRNVIDMGQSGTWSQGPTGWNLDILVHEIGHIVEGSSKGVKESPAFGLWGDSKWCEIFQYDVYKALELTTEKERWFNTCMNATDNFPRAGTQWFKNWFYPIYNQYGESEVLNNYYQLLSEYFPQYNGAYTRALNWGEFIHFWSGAAGVNLKQQATIAFGWPEEWEFQFRQAQVDFPFTYAEPGQVQATTTVSAKVEKAAGMQVEVWPNPANGKLNILMPVRDEVNTVDIYTITGSKIYTGRMEGGAAAINTTSFKPGFYILHIGGANGVVYKKKVLIK